MPIFTGKKFKNTFKKIEIVTLESVYYEYKNVKRKISIIDTIYCDVERIIIDNIIYGKKIIYLFIH